MKKKIEKTEEEIKNEPLIMKMTGKNGETDFYLYIKGEDKNIRKVIGFLQKYLTLCKVKK